MAASMEEDGLVEEDFYSLLNIPRTATDDEINGAFRRLSKLFHPDKHSDPSKKKNAEYMFDKIKKAHGVLINPTTRVIYDRLGVKGSKIEGMELLSREKSAAEIIAELDRLQNEQEERKLQKQTNPRGTVEMRINATELFDSYDDEYSSSLLGVEISSLSLQQGVDCPLTKKDTVKFVGSVMSGNGTGQGMFTTGWRHLWSSKGWHEVEMSMGSGLGGGLRSFYQINRHCFCVGTISMIASPRGTIAPDVKLLLARQLDRNFQGRIIISATSIKTILMYANELYNVNLSFTLGTRSSIRLAVSRIFSSYDAKATLAVRLGTDGMAFDYGVDKKITQFSWLGANMSIGTYDVSLRMKLSRGQQTFVIPIKLAENVVPNAIFYGTFLPVVSYFVIRKLIVAPYIKDQEEQHLEQTKKDSMEKQMKQREEAEAAIDLMLETVERVIEIEESRNGLIITKAIYGRLLSESEGMLSEDECINVTIPVQILVKDSSLQLPESQTKADIPGFYDPCPGVDKSLYIQYRFRNHLHEVTLQDEEPIRLPLQSHLVSQISHDSSGE